MLFIIPTDTCFWIWCEISDVENYHKIYKIKKRDLSKPLAIMVLDFSWLEDNTSLTKEQVEFLKNYERPFTIMTDCPRIKMVLELEQEDFSYENASQYKKIAFRVANTDLERKLISDIWPIFLTSANFSWEKEIYSTTEAKKQFSKYLKEIKFIPEDFEITWKLPPSDIFEFVWDSLEVKYLRKN